MAAGTKTLSKTFVWILMGLLIAGLAGFGVLNMSGTLRTVATVGDQTLSVDDYVREMQRQIRQIEAQTGQPLQMDQARMLGIEQSVLARLVALAALDNEVADLGMSIGDENLQREIITIAAFQGPSGAFDREAYRFQLEQANINEAEFEADLRTEAARTIVQGAIVEGVVMPDALSDTITNFIAVRRSFTYVRLDETALDTPPADPSDAQVRAYYDANGADFTLPETKHITYVLMTPAMLLDQVDVDEATLRDLYRDRQAIYNIPERRLVERLVFSNQTAAGDAMAQLEVGGTTFEALVSDRGLSLADVDLGDLSRDDLGEVADAVFGADIGQVVGPLESGLGPALYRINGSLAEQITSFEDVRAALHEELAGERTRRLIDAQAENIDDLLAGGATLQELADETDMELGEIAWTALSSEGIAAYEAFREAAALVSEGDFPEVGFLEDGAIFALQLDQTLPTRPEPFETAHDRVRAAWILNQTELALQVRAERVVADYATTGDFTSAGVEPRVEAGLTRTSFLEGTPPGFMNEVFEMDQGEIRVVSGDRAVFIVRLDQILPPEETAELGALRTRLGQEASQSLAQALFNAFVSDAQFRARPNVDQRAINAVLASFSGGGGGGIDSHAGHNH